MAELDRVPTIERRKLGEQERLFQYLHRYGALIAVQVLHLRGRFSSDQLRAGLDWLQLRHPMLRAHIEFGKPVLRSLPPYVYLQPYFSTDGTGPIPLRIVTDPTPDAWRVVFEEELRTPLGSDANPRMRAVLVRAHQDAETCQLFLTSDHAIADAQATNMASRDLLGFLSGLPPPPLPASSLPEALEARLVDAPATPGAYTPAQRIPIRKSKGGGQTMRTLKQTFAPEATTRLKQAIRAQRTSMHGAISAAFLLALRQCYGISSMTELSTVDLRRMCRPVFPAETFGCYIDLVRTAHPVSDDFWEVARDVSFKLITALAKHRRDASIMKLWGPEVYRAELWPLIATGRRIDGLAVTTAGESGLVRTYGDLMLEEVTMAVSTSFIGSSFFVISNEWAGQLDLHIGFPDYAVEPADANAISNVARQILDQVVVDSGG